MARKYLQGKYIVKNREKYVGDINNVIYRSSWELKLFIWLDNNPSILNWNAEEVIVPYISPIDNKQHRYFLDCTIKYKTKSGEIKTSLIEVKPKAQTLEPKMKKNKKLYVEEVKTFLINSAKWKAAREFASKNNIDFVLLTEDELGIKK